MNEQWSDNLRERMETHREPSPEGLWESIEQVMGEEIRTNRRKKKQMIWLIGATCSGIAAAVLLLFMISPFKTQPLDNRLASTSVTAPETAPETNLVTNYVTSLVTTPVTAPVEHEVEPVASHSKSTRVVSVMEQERALTLTTAEATADSSQEALAQATDTTRRVDPVGQRSVNNQARRNQLQTTTRQSEPLLAVASNKSEKWRVGLYASNFSTTSSGEYGGYGSLLMSEDPNEGYKLEPFEGEVLSLIFSENQLREVYSNAKHSQPINVGFSVDYQLNDHLSVGSGLMWVQLYSELRSGSNNYYYQCEQTLNNVGVPLTVNYNFLTSKRLSLYVSGGGFAEKNVAGKLIKHYIVNDVPMSNEREDVRIKEWQWSVNTSVGVQYQLLDNLGIYAEPGMSYYFANGSKVATIYQEKRFNTSVHLGLRLLLGHRNH
ncbi:MAG: PorT family protein [Bacteroidales bacterium]|nr:PorT family protein [Bacteroidales bacterium]